MSKNKKSEPDYSVAVHHQTALRLLLADRAVFQAQARAAIDAHHAILSDFVSQILMDRNLDPKVWGISRDLTKFVVLETDKPVQTQGEQSAPTPNPNDTDVPAPAAPVTPESLPKGNIVPFPGEAQ